MKYAKRICALICVIAVCFTLVCTPSVHADPISSFTLGGIAYAIGQYSGLGFIFGNASSQAVSGYMQSQIESYAGDDITTKFAIDEARLVSGKLVVGQKLYNDIKNFLSWLIDGKSDGDIILPGEINGIVINNLNTESGEFSGYYFDGGVVTGTSVNDSYIWFNVTSGQLNVSKLISYFRPDLFNKEFIGWSLNQDENNKYYVSVVTLSTRISTGAQDYITSRTHPSFVMSGDLFNTGTINVSNYDDDNIDVGYQWEGTFPDAPDTNLDQLIGHIYEEVADTNLEVEGEITEAGPAPTPAPTIAPDTPLQNVPWDGLNDLIGSSTGTIDDAIQDQTDAITEAQEATTEAVDSLKEAIEGALDTPSSEDLPDFKFDLRELFPFCIPFDIYRLLSSFDAEPQAPHVQLPIVIDSIGFSYMMDLDFSAWNPVAQAMRTAELIVYAIALAWATGKVIKW